MSDPVDFDDLERRDPLEYAAWSFRGHPTLTPDDLYEMHEEDPVAYPLEPSERWRDLADRLRQDWKYR